MRSLLWLLALFLLAVSIALLARFNDGYLLLVFPPYRIELSLNLVLILIASSFAIFYGVLRSLALTFSFPGQVREFREKRGHERAVSDFQEALRFLFEGRFSRALQKASAAHDAGHWPGLSALLAAHAAQRMHELAKQEIWLTKDSLSNPQMQVARLMLEAQMHIDAQRFNDALIALQGLQKIDGRHIAALRLELRAQQGCGHWDEVLRLTRLLEKRDRLLPELATEIKLKAHGEHIRQSSSDSEQLLAYLGAVPSAELCPRLVRSFVDALIELGASPQAQELIEKQLDAEWDSALALLYGQIKGGDPTARIARADQWLLLHNDDSQLLLALGRLCFTQRLWGKAQSYLEASLSLVDRRETHLELARLFEQTERPDEAMRHYRAAAENFA